ncbi:acyltransferase family protein [Bacillus solimangrovi]|uniref:Acyltransferase 3 domain-containing protein n=1 Tax=Bacillus solimangrovi TaxID=1305675 RepID=A0A1E5LIF1_9BACI|nr:acyltransferase family protein [Bacillus solimangrovi]OEH93864.1 hypothetical protein BFG57_11125 [Bacillus solimangrovi]
MQNDRVRGVFVISKETTNKKSRDPFFDNARFILVFLVVFGHLLSPFRNESEILHIVSNFISIFRMPALILMSGYFSKSFYKKGFIHKIIAKTLVPYFIFEIVYSYYNFVLYDYESLTFTFFTPTMGMWFLFSMFCWNVMLFVFTKIKYSILVSFLLGIGIGLFDDAGSYLSLSRTFVFFPFFLIGYYLKADHFNWIKQRSGKIVSIGLIIGCIVSLILIDPVVMRKFLLGKYSFDAIGYTPVFGMFYRVIIYMVMICGILAFLPWVPKKQTSFTHLGQRTAYVFILHFFFIKYVATLDWYLDGGMWNLLIIPFFTVVISFVLSSNYVVNLTKPLIEGSVFSFVMNKWDFFGSFKPQKPFRYISTLLRTIFR